MNRHRPQRTAVPPLPARRRLIAGAAASAGLGLAGAGRAQAPWPSRPITLLVPVPPGSVIDGVSRALAASVSATLKQPVVIENRPGASATMPASILAQNSAADGYTLGVIPATLFKLPHLQKLAYDPLRDLTYIMAFTGLSYALAVLESSPWKTAQQFIAHAKANPGKVSIGATAAGSSGHIAIHALSQAAGIDVTFVPFKGGAEVLTAFIGGHVDAVLDAGWAQLEKQGKGRILASFMDKRIGRLPDVPTARELGINVGIRSPLGVIGPKGMDPKVVAVIHDAFKTAMSDPTYRRTMDTFDLEDVYLSGDDYFKLGQQLFVDEKRNLDALGIKGT